MPKTQKPIWKDDVLELFVSRRGEYRNITLKSLGGNPVRWRLYNLLASPHRVKVSLKCDA